MMGAMPTLPGYIEVYARFARRFGKGLAIFLLAVLPMLGGCATVRTTDPPRTATEQFLISQASIQAVQQLSTTALRDREVYIETGYFDSIDQPFVVGELRTHLLLNGVRLARHREESQIVLEIRTGGIGIDRYDYLLGIPPIFIPASAAEGDLSDGGTIITPELAVVKSVRQRGFASVAFVAYWRDSGEVVASSGPYVGRTEREDWWFFGVGPRTTGDVATSVEKPD